MLDDARAAADTLAGNLRGSASSLRPGSTPSAASWGASRAGSRPSRRRRRARRSGTPPSRAHAFEPEEIDETDGEERKSRSRPRRRPDVGSNDVAAPSEDEETAEEEEAEAAEEARHQSSAAAAARSAAPRARA